MLTHHMKQTVYNPTFVPDGAPVTIENTFNGDFILTFPLFNNEAGALTKSLCIYFFRMASTDTTSTMITYLFWELSRHLDMMKRLQAELDEAMSDSRVLSNISILSKLGISELRSAGRDCGVNFAELRTRPQLIGCALT